MNFNIQKYFNPYLDYRGLGLFRLFLGSLLIIDLLVNKWPNLEAFYTDSGLLNRETLASIIEADGLRSIYNLGLLSFFDSINGVQFFFSLSLLCYICLTIGFRSRVFSVLAFIALWSIHQRNSFVLSGPDELMINFLFIGMFLPLDQRFTFFRSGIKLKANQHKGIASFYFLFFIGLVYFFQAFLKTGHLWENGDAISYALMETIWTKPWSSFLLEQEAVCTFLTKSTLWIEYSIPLLIFFPWINKWTRVLAVILLIGLHGTIFIFLDLGLFPFIVPTFAVLLLPSNVFDYFENKLKQYKLKIKAIEMVPITDKYKGKFKSIAGVFLIFILFIVTWKSSLSSERLKEKLPNPEFMKSLNNTSMFSQYWGFYAPNPSITHGWFKVVGVKPDGTMVDLRTMKLLSMDDSEIDAYRNYSWNVFYYKTMVYNYVSSRPLLDRWSEFEYQAARETGHRIVQVQIISFKQRIL